MLLWQLHITSFLAHLIISPTRLSLRSWSLIFRTDLNRQATFVLKFQNYLKLFYILISLFCILLSFGLFWSFKSIDSTGLFLRLESGSKTFSDLIILTDNQNFSLFSKFGLHLRKYCLSMKFIGQFLVQIKFENFFRPIHIDNQSFGNNPLFYSTYVWHFWVLLGHFWTNIRFLLSIWSPFGFVFKL